MFYIQDMEKAEIQAELLQVSNMRKFATDSRVPLRTLWRVAKNEGVIKDTTLMLIEMQLKRIKPEKKPVGQAPEAKAG